MKRDWAGQACSVSEDAIRRNLQFLAQKSRDVAHMDNVAEKESMWHAVRRPCEQKLKYSRELELHEDVDTCKGIASKGEEAFEGVHEN